MERKDKRDQDNQSDRQTGKGRKEESVNSMIFIITAARDSTPTPIDLLNYDQPVGLSSSVLNRFPLDASPVCAPNGLALLVAVVAGAANGAEPNAFGPRAGVAKGLAVGSGAARGGAAAGAAGANNSNNSAEFDAVVSG